MFSGFTKSPMPYLSETRMSYKHHTGLLLYSVLNVPFQIPVYVATPLTTSLLEGTWMSIPST